MAERTTIAAAGPRQRVQLRGVLAAVTYPAAGAPPSLVARLYDSTGDIDIEWLGRREVAGIVPGRRLEVEGIVHDREHRAVIFNPAYRLLSEETA